jgi:hypothetical protein
MRSDSPNPTLADALKRPGPTQDEGRQRPTPCIGNAGFSSDALRALQSATCELGASVVSSMSGPWRSAEGVVVAASIPALAKTVVNATPMLAMARTKSVARVMAIEHSRIQPVAEAWVAGNGSDETPRIS